MGGGDLNTKKSWHPNTIKNQERVWKAEQAAAEEQKRIQQLMTERAQEKDRSELNELAKKRLVNESEDGRLGWMYEKPDKQIQHEDYLLGKAIDKNFDKDENSDKNAIPAVSRRVVGSSMLSSTSEAQVDITRKMREDPLLMVKERERAARAALLNNPLQRKKITELLRKEQEQKATKKSKKSSKSKDDLDKKLAEKLNALSGKSSINLASLLSSDDDDSSDDGVKKNKKKKKKKKEKNHKKSKRKVSESEPDNKTKSNSPATNKRSSEDARHSKDEYSSYRKEKYRREDSRDHRSPKHDNRKGHHEYDHNSHRTEDKAEKKHGYDSDDSHERKQNDSRQAERRNNDSNKHYDYRQNETRRNYKHSDNIKKVQNKNNRDYETTLRERHTETSRKDHRRSAEGNDGYSRKRKSGLSDSEIAARLQAMAAAGTERERERAQRVAESGAKSEDVLKSRSTLPPPRAALPDSLEARIHSNRHNIQRNQRHMDQHFARR